jgi:glycosyltransferase involved in cell wall biosynthesis
LKKICFVLTIPFTLNAFVRPHLERLSRIYDITICVNMDDSEIAPVVPQPVRLVQLAIRRQIALWSDLNTLLVLMRFFRHERFDLVYSLTPKGGLLGMLAAWLASVPNRVHCFTGQVWATRSGFSRWLLKGMDRLLAACTTRLLADSASQRQYLIDQGITGPEKIEVLANGSMAGVDAGRFHQDADARKRVRSRLGIDESAFCLLFVGRLTREKGVPDLIEAFRRLVPVFPSLQLLLVGPDEGGFDRSVQGTPNVHRVGYTPVVEEYMAAADVFCLPSYREGFGLVLIEAGAAGLPVVASRIYGISDAVIDGETGLLHKPGEVGDMVEKLEALISDASLHRALAEAGRLRALQMFSAEIVTTALADFLQRLFADQSLPGDMP